MCVIVVKLKGVDIPSTLKKCFDANSDGAGYMYARDGAVVIRKGFMTYESFEDSVNAFAKHVDAKALPMVFHFRIGTHGRTRAPEHCHPFPITDDIDMLEALRGKYDYGVAHNGILSDYTNTKSEMSDTMLYISSVLYPIKRMRQNFITNDAAKTLLKNTLHGFNKVAIMDRRGKILILGGFTKSKEDKCLYSNESWKYSYAYRGGYYKEYYDDAGDEDFNAMWNRAQKKESSSDIKDTDFSDPVVCEYLQRRYGTYDNLIAKREKLFDADMCDEELALIEAEAEEDFMKNPEFYSVSFTADKDIMRQINLDFEEGTKE